MPASKNSPNAIKQRPESLPNRCSTVPEDVERESEMDDSASSSAPPQDVILSPEVRLTRVRREEGQISSSGSQLMYVVAWPEARSGREKTKRHKTRTGKRLHINSPHASHSWACSGCTSALVCWRERQHSVGRSAVVWFEFICSSIHRSIGDSALSSLCHSLLTVNIARIRVEWETVFSVFYMKVYRAMHCSAT